MKFSNKIRAGIAGLSAIILTGCGTMSGDLLGMSLGAKGFGVMKGDPRWYVIGEALETGAIIEGYREANQQPYNPPQRREDLSFYDPRTGTVRPYSDIIQDNKKISPLDELFWDPKLGRARPLRDIYADQNKERKKQKKEGKRK